MDEEGTQRSGVGQAEGSSPDLIYSLGVALSPDDIVVRLSGGIANSDPAASLGGDLSSVEVISDSPNNLWSDVDSSDAAAGLVDHRAVYVVNDGDATLVGATVWIDLPPTIDQKALLGIGLPAEGVGVEITQTLDLDTDVPAGVVFTSPTAKGSGLVLGDLPAGSFRGLWLRRSVLAGAMAGLALPSVRCEAA